MCHPTIEMSIAVHSAATNKPFVCAQATPVSRGILKNRRHSYPEADLEVELDDDARSSAATPPPHDTESSVCVWVTRKRACVPGGRRVCIKTSSDLRYIDDIAALTNSCTAWPRPITGADAVEETKFCDGPSPEAVVVDRLLLAVTSTSDTASVCPILKALVKTGASDLLSRVHERLLTMDGRIGQRGKVSMLPSTASLGHESAPLICFLHESVVRSTGLVAKFQDRNAQVFEAVDAEDAGLEPSQRSTAAALLLLSMMPPTAFGQGIEQS